MIKEISNFVESLDPEFKTLGMKPKEGLHILLRIQSDGETSFIDQNSLVSWGYTRKKNQSQEDVIFLQRCASLSQASWCVNTNKCFDLPLKAIHSCSPYCLALKRENLINGEKYSTNARDKKPQIYDRISTYFAKTFDLLNSEEDKQRVEIFKYALNSQEKLHTWLNLIPVFEEIKDAEYVIFYLDEPFEKYQNANAKYLGDKLFNTNDYNQVSNTITYGTSDFFNGFPTKKPFLTHQTATFDISGRIAAQEAKALYEFLDIIGRGILPKPLPIFIYNEELQGDAIALFKTGAEEGKKIGYQTIIESLYKSHKENFGNYYLLFYQAGEIKDFDFVSKFEYELRDKEGNAWEIKDLFDINYTRSITNVFELQYAVLVPIFNNALVSKTKAGDFQFKYFDDVDAKYCKSDNTYLLVVTYRKAFYDFIYKSKRQAISQSVFDHILQTGILDDMRLDEFKNNQHSQNGSIRRKLNIWFSLSEKFNQYHKSTDTMGNNLQTHREFIKKLAKGEANIQTDDQYAFTVGQVIYYLLSKSKTADRSYKRLEPFLQQVHAKELNKAIARLFDTYKHEEFSSNFRIPFAEVMDYETKANMRDFMPITLAGIFSKNALFSNKEEQEVETQIQESEE
ncbi:hypothetical protein [Xanthocytophaga flava]|uniref:hypothetical protein n=1 Tax=Xanthocytophaga flava TaxID=3048013 RepID=UPI0028D44436|nr:hypothetical protein [Xanthocytophaga flavus]MDJ1473778.1 hypothetical protein [Xanthocytophaga flavus]